MAGDGVCDIADCITIRVHRLENQTCTSCKQMNTDYIHPSKLNEDGICYFFKLPGLVFVLFIINRYQSIYCQEYSILKD